MSAGISNKKVEYNTSSTITLPSIVDLDNNPYASPTFLDLKFRDERASRIFSFNKTTGVISVDPQRQTANVGTYQIEVTVDDQRGKTTTYKFSVEIVNNDPPPVVKVEFAEPVVEQKKEKPKPKIVIP